MADITLQKPITNFNSGRYATKRNDSKILLYSVSDSKLDPSKNLINDLNDLMNENNYYDKSAMWGRIVLNSSSPSQTINVSQLEPEQHYVLIYDREENTDNEVLTPNMFMSYVDINEMTDLGQMPMFFDTHLVRFKTPAGSYSSTLTVELGNTPEGEYTFSNFAVFKASDYETMLLNTKDIECVIPENSDYKSKNEKKRKEAIYKMVDE